ncbi:gp53-like domain-containing protein [Gluconacetobacter entanii]|uniref:gp53-like domain-containing protein n=1 Tax=Gluconacetobacter entanii TaxID=108528 RepID=UPI00223563CA|nr:hypothetical protein [Gluconacetobacter entanii]MCW4588076.1 hypothetical protein [Gluconacetobacter entanii]
MDYTSASGYATDSSGRRQYVDRDNAAGVQGTYLLAADRNMDRNELVNLVLQAGLTLDGADEAQVAQAVNRLASAAVVSGAGLGKSQGENGYQILPGGTILQWGVALSGTGGVASVQFPIAFPNQCLGLHAGESEADGGWGSGNPTLYSPQKITAGTTTSAGVYSMYWNGSAWVGAVDLGFFWWAWGY